MIALILAAFLLINVKEVHGAGKSFLNIFKREVVEEKIVVPPVEIPEVPLILQKIAWCESRGKQFNDDGSVHRGKINNKDVGLYQINEFYHLHDSLKLGFDIYTLQGNTDYALYLYKTQSTKPWNWSAPCWKNELTLDELKAKYK